MTYTYPPAVLARREAHNLRSTATVWKWSAAQHRSGGWFEYAASADARAAELTARSIAADRLRSIQAAREETQ